MKTSTTIFCVAICIIAAALLFTGCAKENYTAYSITVIADKTEEFLAKPDREAIKELLGNNKNFWQGNQFRLLTTTDVGYNPVEQAEISSECEYLSNEYDRRDKHQAFLSSIDSAFAKVDSLPVGRKNSAIYQPLARELKTLSHSTAHRKIIVLYSDLMEASSVASFYRPKVQQQLKLFPDLMAETLEKKEPIPNLQGIEVYIIFQAKNAEESRVFDITSGFYKILLEKHGAKVYISANLVIEQH